VENKSGGQPNICDRMLITTFRWVLAHAAPLPNVKVHIVSWQFGINDLWW